MDSYNKQLKGRQAEQLASRFLQAKGLHLLQQNFRCYHGEIDLVMQDQLDIVFVEVRSRSRLDYGSAAESINKRKQQRLIKTAMYFLQAKRWLDKVNSRFDVVAIHLNNDLQVEWIKNAFWLEGLK